MLAKVDGKWQKLAESWWKVDRGWWNGFQKSFFKATSSIILEQNVGQSIADDVVGQLVDNVADLRPPLRQVDR